MTAADPTSSLAWRSALLLELAADRSAGIETIRDAAHLVTDAHRGEPLTGATALAYSLTGEKPPG